MITVKGEGVEINAESAQKAKFSIEYLNKMLLKIGDRVHVGLQADYPFWVEYKSDKFSLVFILAPRVDNSD